MMTINKPTVKNLLYNGKFMKINDKEMIKKVVNVLLVYTTDRNKIQRLLCM